MIDTYKGGLVREVIIHAGFHKTASSSVQHSLARNRDLLEKSGFHFPDFEFSRGSRFYNQSIPLYGLFCSEPTAFRHYWYNNNLNPAQINTELMQYLRSILGKHDKLIFSDEFFSKLSTLEFKSAKELFESAGYRVRVISYVREPFSSLTSSAQQQSRAKSINQVIQAPNDAPQKIKNLTAVFGDNAEFYSFERACKHRAGPAGFFFSLLGIELESIQAVKVNEGGSMQAARLASFINETCPLFLSQSVLNPLRNRLDVIPLFEAIKGEKFSFIQSEMKFVVPHVEQARDEISDLLGDDFLPALDIGKIPEGVFWNVEQINTLAELSSKLDLNLMIRINDYFSGAHGLIEDGAQEALFRLTTIIRERLETEMNTNNPKLKDKLKAQIVNVMKKYTD